LFTSVKRYFLENITKCTTTSTPLSHDEYDLPQNTVRVNRLKATRVMQSGESRIRRAERNEGLGRRDIAPRVTHNNCRSWLPSVWLHGDDKVMRDKSEKGYQRKPAPQFNLAMAQLAIVAQATMVSSCFDNKATCKCTINDWRGLGRLGQRPKQDKMNDSAWAEQLASCMCGPSLDIPS
jgi:hypothetical protein